VNADSGERRQLLSADRCPQPLLLQWSPTGEQLSCHWFRTEGARVERMVHIADLAGLPLLDIGPVIEFAWSPTGRHLAYSRFLGEPSTTAVVYHIADAMGRELAQALGGIGPLLWSPDGLTLAYQSPEGRPVLFQIGSGRQRELGPPLDRVLAWVQGGEALLVATDYQEGEGFGASYQGQLLHLETNAMRRVPQLDNDTPFWVSPSGRQIVHFSSEPGRPPGLRVLDLPTLSARPIPNSTIAFPGERIPTLHVAFAPDGSYLMWASVERTLALYRAPLDGGAATMVTTLPGLFVQPSPDLAKLGYIVPGDPPRLWTADPDGSAMREIGPFFNAFAWRPAPHTP
jgi:hypothetical protein